MMVYAPLVEPVLKTKIEQQISYMIVGIIVEEY